MYLATYAFTGYLPVKRFWHILLYYSLGWIWLRNWDRCLDSSSGFMVNIYTNWIYVIGAAKFEILFGFSFLVPLELEMKMDKSDRRHWNGPLKILKRFESSFLTQYFPWNCVWKLISIQTNKILKEKIKKLRNCVPFVELSCLSFTPYLTWHHHYWLVWEVLQGIATWLLPFFIRWCHLSRSNLWWTEES